MKTLPRARNNEIVVQELGKEVLIYDLTTYKAFNLNETSADVYRACDGNTTFEELNRKHKLTDDLILLDHDELMMENLLEENQN